MATETKRTVRVLLNELKARPRVPFIPDMEVDGYPDCPSGYGIPMTKDTYWRCLDFLPPRLDGHGYYVAGEGSGPFFYFWKEGADFYVAQMTDAESAELIELSRRR